MQFPIAQKSNCFLHGFLINCRITQAFINCYHFAILSDDNKKVNIWGNTRENYSGRGPTSQCVIKPDILAPGADIISCMTTTPETERLKKPDAKLVSKFYLQMSGTSMATPIISGSVALLLQKNPELKPDEVKFMLKNGTKNLNFPKNRQGWGLIDIEKLLES